MKFTTNNGTVCLTPVTSGAGYLWLAIAHNGKRSIGTSASLAYAKTDASIALCRATRGYLDMPWCDRPAIEAERLISRCSASERVSA